MKVLFLTWEFPPFISGGMGMACYGMVKALLQQGVEVDMLLPTSDDVFFELRKPEDVDILPHEFLDPSRRLRKRIEFSADPVEVKKRLAKLGLSSVPESYLTPGVFYAEIMEKLELMYREGKITGIEELKVHLSGEENLFRKVKEFATRAFKYASFLKCDVIHANDWLTYPAGILLKEITGRPLLAHIHATEFDRAGGPGDERIHKIEYAGLSAANKVITVSQYTMRMVVDRYQIDPNKIRVVHNAYTLASMITERRNLFKDPMVLFLGRVTIQKGPDYFIEVARRVVEKYPKVRFVMAGSGDMFSKSLRGAASRRLKDRFLFTGFLNREQVENLLAATDIYVLPSVSEPFGIAPLEAMAYGAVAIVSKQSGVSEVVKYAYKVDFWDVDKTADIIVELLNDPEMRMRVAAEGRQEAMAMGWQEAATKLVPLYEETLCLI